MKPEAAGFMHEICQGIGLLLLLLNKRSLYMFLKRIRACCLVGCVFVERLFHQSDYVSHVHARRSMEKNIIILFSLLVFLCVLFLVFIFDFSCCFCQ